MLARTTLAAFGLMLPAAVGAQPAARAESPLVAAERVADWQLARLGGAGAVTRNAEESADSRSWIRAAFWIGLTALAEREPRGNRFAAAILAMGAANRWRPGDRPYHADDQAIAQAYLWAARHGAGQAALRRRLAPSSTPSLARPPRVGLAFIRRLPVTRAPNA